MLWVCCTLKLLKTSYYLKCLFRTYWFNHSVNNINVYGVLVSSCLSNYNIRVQFKKWSTHTDTQCESVVRMFGRMLEHDRRQRALAIRWETKNDRKISIAVSSLVKTWSTLNFVLMRYFESKSISKNDFFRKLTGTIVWFQHDTYIVHCIESERSQPPFFHWTVLVQKLDLTHT